MKKYSFLLPALLMLLASCEKVVNIDLNNAAAQYVIEGAVYEGIDTVEVQIAKTTDYYGRAPQEQINNAIVTLSDDAGNLTNIPFAGEGKYLLPNFQAFAGRRYDLKVVINGNEFNASSVMPQAVNIDSVSVEFKNADFRAAGYEVAARFTDAVNEKNFYRLVYIINDTLQNTPNDLYLLDDKFNDGKPIRADLFRRFEIGDKVEFELLSMDEQVFDFFTTLNDVLNNQNGPAPANPNSNIKGGALGYFATFTSSKKGIIVN
ncbi:MAG TPA: DUF4249 domain-containing protein [Flavipsychrobacter sp.]|nr:DUF4249 domain-containing protein [Flavipsychrobacter sp.]